MLDQTTPVESTALSQFFQKKQFGLMMKSRIHVVPGRIFNTYYFITEDNQRVFKAERCLLTTAMVISDCNDNFLCKFRSNIYGTHYTLKTEATELLEIKYETTQRDVGKPRSLKIKIEDLVLINKKPYFNTETNSYSLNFSGRVTRPSAKNFQVIHPLEPTYITLTFGKESHDTYILDFTYPWSALNAFCVGLSALDHKYGCD